MSTILDALKKSEKQRKQGSVPELGAIRPPEERRGLVTRFAAVGVVVLLAVVYATYRFASAPGPSSKGVEQTPGPAPQVAVEPAQQTGAVTPDPRRDAPLAEAPASIREYTKLEKSLRDALPEMRVGVISYSEDPERRFAMIGGEIYRTDEFLSDEVMLERIEPNAVVLDFRGQKIRVRP